MINMLSTTDYWSIICFVYSGNQMIPMRENILYFEKDSVK